MKRIRILMIALIILLLVGCETTQKNPITLFNITKDSVVVEEIEVLVGDTFQLDLQINGNAGSKINWESSNPEILSIDDEGNVFVSGLDLDKANQVISVIKTIAYDPEVGSIYKGKVVRILDFGAFVELAPGKDGLVHISKLAPQRVNKVEDVVSLGDVIYVKVMEIDEQGRINLSKKDADADIAAKMAEKNAQ